MTFFRLATAELAVAACRQMQRRGRCPERVNPGSSKTTSGRLELQLPLPITVLRHAAGSARDGREALRDRARHGQGGSQLTKTWQRKRVTELQTDSKCFMTARSAHLLPSQTRVNTHAHLPVWHI